MLCAAVGNARAGEHAVEITLLDGRALRGEMSSLTPRIVVRVAERTEELTWDDLLSLRLVDERSADAAATSAPAGPAAPNGLLFELKDGSRFAGEVYASSNVDFSVRIDALGIAKLDASMIAAVHAPFALPSALALLDAPSSDEADSSDIAVVSRDQKHVILRGVVKHVSETGVVFTWNDRDVNLPWSRVAGIRFARSAPRQSPVLIETSLGWRIAGRISGETPEGVLVASSAFDNLELTWKHIARIESRSQRVVILSDLKPAAYELESFFDKKWDFALDRSLSGRAIRLGGRTFDRGIAMHSRSDLSFRLDGGFSRFAALAGIADEMNGRGSVDLRVMGDGNLLWRAANVRGGQPPLPVIVDVTGVQTLTLSVDFGEDLDLSDQAVWAFARLIR